MDFASFFVQALNGLASASSLFLVAAGLSLIFGVTRIVNFAHGSFFMLGAFCGLTAIKLTGSFWWALLLILFFSVNLGWTPVSGRISVMFFIETRTGFMLVDTLLAGDGKAFWSAVRHLILPMVALGTIPLAVVARMTRSAMLEVLSEDYIRTARAKGLSPFRIVTLHALRNALIPVVTVIGLQVGLLLSGAILTETIFSWPGIGKWLIESVRRRDYPVLQGGVLLAATVVMLVNLTVDLLYGLINPRIRHGR